MSSGTLLQLAAKGGEDIFLTGNPEITFFKSVYKRHTNFAQEINKLVIPKSNLNQNNVTRCSVNIPRNGDLLYTVFLGVTLPAIFSSGPYIDSEKSKLASEYKFKWIKYIGNNIINTIKIYINGQKIDEITGEYLTIDNELNLTDDKKKLYYDLIGHNKELNEPEFAYDRYGLYPNSSLEKSDIFNYNKPPSIESKTLYIPLNFWFCKHTGQALPLIALQNSIIKMEFEFKPLNDLYTLFNSAANKYIKPRLQSENLYNFIGDKLDYNPSKIPENDFIDFNIHLECTYIHLDTNERKLFANKTHDYLIKTVKHIEEKNHTPGIISIELKPLHPVNELFIVAQRTDHINRNDFNNYTNWENNVPEWQNVNFTPHYRRISSSIEFSQSSYWSLLNKNNKHNNIRFREHAGAIIIEKYISTDNTGNENWKTIFEFDTEYTSDDITDLENNQNIIGNYSSQTKNIIKTLQIYFDGHKKLSETEGRTNEFFSKLQPYLYHRGNTLDGILVYSFALNPWDDIQPSGTFNMTRINKLLLKLETLLPLKTESKYNYNFNFSIYLMSYNILHIDSGIGGLKFVV